MHNRIREIRKKIGLTQEMLSEKIGVSRTQVTKWEIGLQSPNLHWVEKLAKVMNVTPAELISDDTVQIMPAATASKYLNIMIEVWLACNAVATELRAKDKIPKKQELTQLVVSAVKYFFDDFATGTPPTSEAIGKYMLSIILL